VALSTRSLLSLVLDPRNLAGSISGGQVIDNPEAPYWAIDPSRARRLAHRLVMAASHLEVGIDEYLAELDLDRRTDAARLEDDLPF
jgi:hypothetical protein